MDSPIRKNKKWIEENHNFNYSAPEIQQLIDEISADSSKDSLLEFALKAYYHIRDTWPYNPNRISLVEEDWKASKIYTRKTGHCLDKAVLYISVLRARRIPARLGLAKVRNHIAVADILNKFGNDVLVPHGYVELYLHNQWVKATPAFNKRLCNKLNIEPLDFDGYNDSLFQAYDNSGQTRFMEYIEDYGTFDQVPLSFILQLIKKTYPALKERKIALGMILNLNDL